MYLEKILEQPISPYLIFPLLFALSENQIVISVLWEKHAVTLALNHSKEDSQHLPGNFLAVTTVKSLIWVH